MEVEAANDRQPKDEFLIISILFCICIMSKFTKIFAGNQLDWAKALKASSGW
jgi:hypothetical protein